MWRTRSPRGQRRAERALLFAKLAGHRPVVTATDARLYASENRDAVCAARGPAPPGTPVSEPLQTRGTLMQVLVLDALWHWAPPAKCPAVHEGPVWIETSAVSRSFP